MSFFDSLGLAEQVVSDESANIDGGAFPLINGGTNSIVVIHKAEWKDAFEAGQPRYIQFSLKLTDTSFKDCFARCKIHINDADIKKRQKAANLFSRFYALCGLQPPATLPTDQDLALFTGHPLGCEISYWSMQDKQTGVWTDGNWVGSIFATTGFVSYDGKILPVDIAKLNANAVPQQVAPTAQRTQQMQQAPTAPTPQYAQQAVAPQYAQQQQAQVAQQATVAHQQALAQQTQLAQQPLQQQVQQTVAQQPAQQQVPQQKNDW